MTTPSPLQSNKRQKKEETAPSTSRTTRASTSRAMSSQSKKTVATAKKESPGPVFPLEIQDILAKHAANSAIQQGANTKLLKLVNKSFARIVTEREESTDYCRDATISTVPSTIGTPKITMDVKVPIKGTTYTVMYEYFHSLPYATYLGGEPAIGSPTERLSVFMPNEFGQNYVLSVQIERSGIDWQSVDFTFNLYAQTLNEIPQKIKRLQFFEPIIKKIITCDALQNRIMESVNETLEKPTYKHLSDETKLKIKRFGSPISTWRIGGSLTRGAPLTISGLLLPRL